MHRRGAASACRSRRCSTSCRTRWRCANVPRCDVLAGEPDRDAVDEQRRVGERLGVTPVDAALVDRGAPPLELPRELRVHGELVGRREQLPRSARRACPPATAVIASPPVERGIAPSCSLARVAERRLQPVVRRRAASARPRRRTRLPRPRVSTPSSIELLLVELAHGRMRVDLLDHQRLRVRRLVLLVVTEPPVADEVDDDVLAEAAPVGHREPRRRRSTASGSSALTWMIGTSKPLARSDE